MGELPDPWLPLPDVSVVEFDDGRIFEVTPDRVRGLLEVEDAAKEMLRSLDKLRGALYDRGYRYLKETADV